MFLNITQLAKTWESVISIAGILAVLTWLLFNSSAFKAFICIAVISALVYLIHANQTILLKGVLKFGL